MTKKYTPATFQPTVRPSWAGILSYIDVNEKAEILDAIICFPNERLGGVKSRFYNETIKPDLNEQYDKFLKICDVRGRSAKTYWGEHKLSTSLTCDKQKDNLLKDKDKVKDKVKVKYNHYGELNNVCLTEEDYNKLLSVHPNLNEAIEVLDTWLGTSGSKNKNKNHYAYFKQNSWVWDRVKPTQQSTPSFENLFYQEKPTEDKINLINEARKKDDEEREKNRIEAERWTAFINSKGYPNILAVVSAGKEVYEKLKAEYRQAGNQ